MNDPGSNAYAGKNDTVSTDDANAPANDGNSIGSIAPSTAIGNEAGSTGATGAIGLIKIRLWCSTI